ncbi:3'(2'),5'-bisphosphate nucleotidase 1-like protein, partial [Drosera capensis]
MAGRVMGERLARGAGSQAVVSFILEREDSDDLRNEGAQEILDRIRHLVNDTLATEISTPLSTDSVHAAIDSGRSEGGPHDRDQYVIALALLDEGKVVLGILACANLPLSRIGVENTESSNAEVSCLFYDVVGIGTYMQPLHGSSPQNMVRVVSLYVNVTAIKNTEEASSLNPLKLHIPCMISLVPLLRIDSHLSRGGDGAIYLRFPHAGYRGKIWDHATGSIVVTEAGGVVTDGAGNPLDFSKGIYLDLYISIVATNQKLMPAVLK